MSDSISFIVIGKNEIKTLRQCLESVHLIKTGLEKHRDCEIIYVDSASNDDSVAVALSCGLVDQIFPLKGEVNAAVARNVGAKYSKGRVLCFLDADMVLLEPCFQKILEEIHDNGNNFVSSDLLDVEYDKSGGIVRKIKRYNVGFNRYETTTGGFFVINRKSWELVAGMRVAFRRNQDLDLGLRLAKRGIKLLRINCIAVHHHTVAYTSPYRFFSDAKQGNFFYPGVLLRKNFLNLEAHKYLFKRYMSSLFLLISVLQVALYLNVTMFFGYCLLWSVLLSKRKSFNGSVGRNLMMRFVVDSAFAFGFIFFYPKTKRHYTLSSLR